MGAGPLVDLLVLDVLEPALVEANPDGAPQPLLLIVSGQVAQLLDLQLVALALVNVGEGRFPNLGGNTGRSSQDILKPGHTHLNINKCINNEFKSDRKTFIYCIYIAISVTY